MNELVRSGSVPWGSIGYVQWAEPEAIRRAYGVEVDGPLVYQIARGVERVPRRACDAPTCSSASTASGSTTSRSSKPLVAKSKPGTQARVEIQRQSKRMTLTIPVESRSEQEVLRPRQRREMSM